MGANIHSPLLHCGRDPFLTTDLQVGLISLVKTDFDINLILLFNTFGCQGQIYAGQNQWHLERQGHNGSYTQ